MAQLGFIRDTAKVEEHFKSLDEVEKYIDSEISSLKDLFNTVDQEAKNIKQFEDKFNGIKSGVKSLKLLIGKLDLHIAKLYELETQIVFNADEISK